jgi:hypothetical protein
MLDYQAKLGADRWFHQHSSTSKKVSSAIAHAVHGLYTMFLHMYIYIYVYTYKSTWVRIKKRRWPPVTVFIFRKSKLLTFVFADRIPYMQHMGLRLKPVRSILGAPILGESYSSNGMAGPPGHPDFLGL